MAKDKDGQPETEVESKRKVNRANATKWADLFSPQHAAAMAALGSEFREGVVLALIDQREQGEMADRIVTLEKRLKEQREAYAAISPAAPRLEAFKKKLDGIVAAMAANIVVPKEPVK